MDRLSSGRWHIWELALKAVSENAGTLLWGKGIVQPMIYVTENEHCHNIYLQALLESGIPGLLLWLALVGLFVFHAFRLLKNRDLPFWQRIAGLPGLALLISETVESNTLVSLGFLNMTVLYFSMGLTVMLSLQNSRKTAALVPEKP